VSATTPVYDWPLRARIAEAERLVFNPSYSDPPPAGVLFEGADAAVLHELRPKPTPTSNIPWIVKAVRLRLS
jgi:hypothetical protein